MKTVTEKLANIQKELHAPKSQKNTFGNYNYRSCEDILEAVKPLASDAGCAIVLTDEPVMVGERHYIKATAILRCGDDVGQIVTVTAYAMEPESKKGMDSAQVTGATSSYARKYALNGLFAIDDTKDADATNDHGKKDEPQRAKITTEQEVNILALAEEVGADIDAFMGWLKVGKLSDIYADTYNTAIAALEKKRTK